MCKRKLIFYGIGSFLSYSLSRHQMQSDIRMETVVDESTDIKCKLKWWVREYLPPFNSFTFFSFSWGIKLMQVYLTCNAFLLNSFFPSFQEPGLHLFQFHKNVHFLNLSTSPFLRITSHKSLVTTKQKTTSVLLSCAYSTRATIFYVVLSRHNFSSSCVL